MTFRFAGESGAEGCEGTVVDVSASSLASGACRCAFSPSFSESFLRKERPEARDWESMRRIVGRTGQRERNLYVGLEMYKYVLYRSVDLGSMVKMEGSGVLKGFER